MESYEGILSDQTVTSFFYPKPISKKKWNGEMQCKKCLVSSNKNMIITLPIS